MKLKHKINLKYLASRIFIYAAMVCAVLSISAVVQAADYYSEGSFQYTIDEDTVSIHSYFGSEEAVVIPSMIAGMKVTGIDDYAFSGCSTMKKLTIPDTVIRVGDAAFTGTKSLEKIYNQSKSIVPKVAEQVLVIEDYPVYVPDGSVEPGGNTETNAGNEENADAEKNQLQTDNQSATVTGNHGFEVDAEEGMDSPYSGVKLPDSNQILSVDDSRNLIVIDEDGTITVLDRNSDYAIAQKGDGTMVIVDANGDEIQITDGRIATLDESKGAKESSEKVNQKKTVIIIVVLCVAAVMVLVGVLFWRRRKR